MCYHSLHTARSLCGRVWPHKTSVTMQCPFSISQGRGEGMLINTIHICTKNSRRGNSRLSPPEVDHYWIEAVNDNLLWCWPMFNLWQSLSSLSAADSNFMCPSLNDPANGAVTVSGLDIGSIANFSCNLGYVLRGSEILRCGMRGIWSASEPTCESI